MLLWSVHSVLLSRVFDLVAAAMKKCAAFSARSSTLFLPFQRDVEVEYLFLRGREWVAGTMRTGEKGNNRGKATIGPMSQDYGEQIPACMSWQTIHDSTVGPKLTIDAGN
jgi:hypothetical protein